MSKQQGKDSVFIALSERPVLTAIRRGFTSGIPIIMLGSLALIVASLPIPAYQDFMRQTFGSGWTSLSDYIKDGTFNAFSVIMAVTISYCYASQFSSGYGGSDPIISSIVALGSLMALFGITRHGFSLSNFGVAGIFVAIATALLSTRIFLWLNAVKWLRLKSFPYGSDSAMTNALQAVVPVGVTISAFAALNLLLSACFGIVDIRIFISDALYSMFTHIASPMLRGMLFVLLVQLLWFFGMHGNNILESVAQKMLVSADTMNQALVAGGQAPTEIFTKGFLDTFVFMGGCGATLCLIAALFIAGKHKNRRHLAAMSLLPGVFNINEIMVFGMPISLNPVFFVPFIAVPMLLVTLSYLAIAAGLVPHVTARIEWTTPIILSGYAATHSAAGIILQIVNLAVGTLCYIPFVRLADKVSERQANALLSRIYGICARQSELGKRERFLSRRDNIGVVSRMLSADLEDALENDDISLYYQPQVHADGRVAGVEALLRWKHASYGMISPLYAIALAEEAGFSERLGLWVLERACADIVRMGIQGVKDIPVSVNLTAEQLGNGRLSGQIAELLDRYSIASESLQIEITEQTALTFNNTVRGQLGNIKTLGVKLVMDDFGMGHNSMLYLKEYDFDCIKLDGSLVCDMLRNSSCCSIITSIVHLAKTMHCTVVAEYVEQPEQRDKLKELGVSVYQGFLYSKAVPLDELLRWLDERKKGA